MWIFVVICPFEAIRVLLELQFAPLDNELGDWFQFLTQRN